MPHYTYYDPSFICHKGFGLEKYPDSVHEQTQIIAVIKKEGVTRAVDVTERVNYNVFSEECCQDNRHAPKATMKLYALPRSVLEDKGSDKPILDSEPKFQARDDQWAR